MKYLVTGGAGFIGSNLVDKLISLGHDVICIDDESAECHEQFYWNDKAQNYKHDICDYDLIAPLFKDVDCVFHVASDARIQPAILNPKNIHVDLLNDIIVDRFVSEEQTYTSIDSCDADSEATYPMEFLHSLHFNGIPRHILRLKGNCVVMCIIRNISKAEGLMNGRTSALKQSKECFII